MSLFSILLELRSNNNNLANEVRDMANQNRIFGVQRRDGSDEFVKISRMITDDTWSDIKISVSDTLQTGYTEVAVIKNDFQRLETPEGICLSRSSSLLELIVRIAKDSIPRAN